MAKKKNLTSPLDLVTLEIVGPSSSHTAGVMRIAEVIRERCGELSRAKITLFNSLADTGDAHMTKTAIVAGLLGFKENDPRIPFSFSHAEDAGLKISWAHRRDESEHPNTLIIEAHGKNADAHSRGNKDDHVPVRIFKGKSIGGGRYKLHESHEKHEK